MIASETAFLTAMEVVVAPETTSTSRFFASRIRAAIMGAAVVPMPMVSSHRSTRIEARSPLATTTSAISSSSWPMAVPIHLPSVKISGIPFSAPVSGMAP